ncbi:MAG: hypothetical protein RML45_04240 [Acetobacteraceae bacterium]|nr:hypothetical protein [Acetobacteraceae bacterium]
MRALVLLITLAAAAACGRLPMPFERTPEAGSATELTRSPPARIVVPPSTSLGLTEEAARRFAVFLAEALQEREVPATAAGILRPRYRLLASAEPAAGVVRLTYTLVDGEGLALGAAGGPRPLPAGPWAGGEEGVLRRAAAEAAPAIAELLARVDASTRLSASATPGARAPTLRLAGVRGAPGDGNVALARALRTALAREGLVVQEGAAAEFDLEGRVSVTDLPRRQQRVEIIWTVSRADGTELGTVTQLNEIPRGTLDGLWADVAVVVANQAAGGVAEVIRRARAGG